MVEEGGRCIQSTLRWKARNEHTKKFARKATIHTTEQHNRSILGAIFAHERVQRQEAISTDQEVSGNERTGSPHLCVGSQDLHADAPHQGMSRTLP